MLCDTKIANIIEEIGISNWEFTNLEDKDR